MEDNYEEKLEKRLNLIVNAAVYYQCSTIAIIGLIIAFKPPFYQKIGGNFSIAALVSSFILSKVYIYTGKKLEEFKTFSTEERALRKKEYICKFFLGYPFWIGCVFLFPIL